MGQRILGWAARRRGTAATAVILVGALAGTVAAGSGRNAVFNLGVANTVSGYMTSLTGSYTGSLLSLRNDNTGPSAKGLTVVGKSTTGSALHVSNPSGGPALSLSVAAGKAPFTTSSGVKVTNLNADKLDNLDSTQLQRRVSGTCADGRAIRSVSATGSVTCEDTIAEAAHAAAADNATNATNAGNADNLDGIDSTGFAAAGHNHDARYYEAGSKVSDSDRLDGIDSSGFVQGGGKVVRNQASVAPGANLVWHPFGPGVYLEYRCPATLTNNGSLRVGNVSGAGAEFFVDGGGGNPEHRPLSNGWTWLYPTAATGELYTIQALGGQGAATVFVSSVHRSGDCYVQAHGVFTP